MSRKSPAGLTIWRTQWRDHLIEVRMVPLSEVDRWFGVLRSIWDLCLDAMAAHFTTETRDD